MWRNFVALWLGCLLVACKIEPSVDSVSAPLVNYCDRDSDCAAGRCDLASRRCGRAGGSFKALLMEVVPPSSDQIYGGRQFFHRVDIARAKGPIELVLPRQRLDGRVTLWLGTCFGHTILFSLRPRVEALGLRPTRLGVEAPTAPEVRENGDLDYSLRLNRFTLSAVPAGKYDIYFRDSGFESLTPECPSPAVPHVERGLTVSGTELSVPYRFDQTSPEPIALSVSVPWRDDLQGWTVDTVHNITGERMSTTATLDGALQVTDPVTLTPTVTVTIRHAYVTGTDYKILTPAGSPFPGNSLLRLRPPDPSTRPTVYIAGLVPLDATGATEVSVPPIGPFSELVDYRAWIWGEGRSSWPIRGQVVLSARTLIDVPGVTVSMSQTFDIAEDGSLQASLLPGNYVADVIPDYGTGFGRFRTELAVWDAPAESDAGATQAGRLIAVPRERVISGRLRGPGGVDPTGTLVRVQPSSRGGFTLTAQVPRFLPRTRDVLVDPDGRFELPVDCSSCSEQAPTSVDVVFRPAEGGGLPWLVFRDLPLTSDLDLGRVSLPVPRLIDGRVLFQNRPGQGLAPLPYSGPRVRAYAMIDRDGNLIEDPTLPDCIDVDPALAPDVAGPCVQRVILLGEASTDRDGHFQLALPPSFGRLD